MRLVVGLGNPGQKYGYTRHNVGFRLVERFAARHGIELDAFAYDGRLGRGLLPGGETVAVFEPLTFMNRSGGPVAQAIAGLGVEDPSADVLVVYDDVDLPFGRLRLRPRGGAGGHNGLADIIAALDTQYFSRLRFGVGRPDGMLEAGDTGDGAEWQDTADWVLAAFSPDEEKRLPGRLDSGADAIELAFLAGVEKAMNRVNAAVPDAEE